MARPGYEGLDTPRSTAGDASFVSRPPNFDMTMEPSFHSPPDNHNNPNNLVAQMRNARAGGGGSLRTPRSRAPLLDKPNVPQRIGGVEFTPLLKSATRNSARRFGKENVAGLRVADDGSTGESHVPVDTSLYGPSRANVAATPLPPNVGVEADDSTMDTPIALPRRTGGAPGLNDGAHMSLREQESVIDKFEKENFGLKLKIHFLEEALQKSGPGFNEAALRENTELKVDQHTLKRELTRYKKQLVQAERDLESYGQQMAEMREKAKKKYADESLKEEIDKMKRILEDKEGDIEDLQQQVKEGGQLQGDKVEELKDRIEDLEADLRAKDQEVSERDDELEGVKDKLDESNDKCKKAERRINELERDTKVSEELDEAKDTITELDATIRRFEAQVDDMRDELQQAVSEKNQAQQNLDELQDELSNKSMATKGLSRQLEERNNRLQSELDQTRNKYAVLEKQTQDRDKLTNDIKTKAKQLLSQRESWNQERDSLTSQLELARRDLTTRSDEKNLLQLRNDALGDESQSLQRDAARLQKQVDALEISLEQERNHALQLEQQTRESHQTDLDALQEEIARLLAELRDSNVRLENESDARTSEKRNLEADRVRADEKAAGLQRTVDALREMEGSLTSKEKRLQDALTAEMERHNAEQNALTAQIDTLRHDLEARQQTMTELRQQLAQTRDQLTQSQTEVQAQTEKIDALEDEVEVLQATLDDEAEAAAQNLETATAECEQLRQKLDNLQRSATLDADAKFAQTIQEKQALQNQLNSVDAQLSDANAQLSRANREKTTLTDQTAGLRKELANLRAALADAKAEREEAEAELLRVQNQNQDNDTFRLDHERLDLRAAKVKLDSEVRRLRDENAALATERETLEHNLEDEMARAAQEEDRLSRSIADLQSRLRQSAGSDSQELITARRTIQKLERQKADLEMQLASSDGFVTGHEHPNEGNSEINSMRRDLSHARQKEHDFLSREQEHRDTVKGLKREIGDLERALHDAEMDRLGSPGPGSAPSTGGRKEVVELRNQLLSANKALADHKRKLRDAVRQSSDQETLQEKLLELEEEKLVLETELKDAVRETGEAKRKYEKAVRRLDRTQQKLSQLQTHGEDGKRKLDHEMAALEQDVMYQANAIMAHEAAAKTLRHKLGKAREERDAWRGKADSWGRDCERLKESMAQALTWIEMHHHSLSASKSGNTKPQDNQHHQQQQQQQQQQLQATGLRASIRSLHDTIHLDVVDQKDHAAVLRAAENARARHEKEIRGLALQLSWMQARWERELRLRQDAGFAKAYVALRLEVAERCNKADLKVLEGILAQLGVESPGKLVDKVRGRREGKVSQVTAAGLKRGERARKNLRVFVLAVRAVTRMRVLGKRWGAQERVKERLERAWSEAKKREPVREWEVGSPEKSPVKSAGGGGGGGETGTGTTGTGGGGGGSGGGEEDMCVTVRF